MPDSETTTPSPGRRRRGGRHGHRAVPAADTPGVLPARATAARTSRNGQRDEPQHRPGQKPEQLDSRLLEVDGSPLTPRITRAPDNLGDIIDRQLNRATSKEHHPYYLKLLKVFRTTLVVITFTFVVAGGLLTAGITAAVHLAGLPMASALGLGALGGGSGVVLGSLWLRKLIGSALAHLKRVNDTAAANPPAPDPDADHAS